MNPIMIDVPEQLETPRLELRKVMSGSGAWLNACVLESLAELAPWMIWVNPPPKVEDTEEWCRGAEAKFIARENLHYHFFLKGTQTFIGTINLFDIDWKVPRFEIGYWMRTSFAGKGFMTEAVKGLTE